MMSASTGTSISGHQTSAPVARARGATAPTWSKCVCVRRIAVISTSSASIAASSRGASSPGSITIAWSAPSSRAMWQFSCTGPTVKLRTSISGPLPSAFGGKRAPGLAHPALPEDPVDLVSERHVDQEGGEAERERGGDRLLVAREPELKQHEQHQRRQAGAYRGAAPGRLGEAALLARVAAGSLALLVGGRLAAGAAARLDRAGGGAAVLGSALALGLGHGPETLAPQQRLDRPRHAQFDVLRPAGERGLRRGRDQLRSLHRMVACDGGEHVGRSHGAVVLDVGRDLDHGAARQPQPERAHSGQSLGAAGADQARDGARVVQRGRRGELEVEGDQRPARRHERRAGGRVQRARPVVGLGAARAQPLRAALAQLGAGAPAGEVAVEEDGDAGGADRVGRQQRLGDRRAALLLLQVHDRRDVERADARVQAVVGAEIDPGRGLGGAGRERAMQLAGRAREEEHRAVVVGIGGAVEDVGVRREGGADRVEHRFVAALRDVGDGDQPRHSRKRPASSTRVPPTSSVASSTRQSRWTGTDTVPPMPALAPNATWTVPSIFSSSRMLPVSVARSLVPTPSSARLRPRSPAASISAVQRAPQSPAASVRRPFSTVSRTRSSGRPSVASVAARIVPWPASGEMKPSPHGRLPNAPSALRSPSSAIASRPPRSSVRSVPRGHVTCASSALVSSSATRRLRAAIVGKSHAMRRASMSSVTPGSVAPRAPASLAALRARVCESERSVGAMKTRAAASAAATAAGGSWPSTSRGSITVTTGSAPRLAATSRSTAPRRSVVRSTTITTSSPRSTPRHGPTTVSTARWRSLMDADDSRVASVHARERDPLRHRRPGAGLHAG